MTTPNDSVGLQCRIGKQARGTGQGIIQWLDRQPASGLFISAITVDEITFGIAILPSGRRLRRLADVFAQIMDVFAERTLSFDAAAAAESARFRAQRRLNGEPMSLADSQIAGVAKATALPWQRWTSRTSRELI